MIRRVNTNLNARTEKPSTAAPNFHYLQPGDTVDVMDVVHGTELEGNDIWFKDADNNFFWSGGFDSLPYPDWMVQLKIPEIWKYATGKGIGVAVIDTGISPANIDLEYQSKYFLCDGITSIEDTQGHGTHCAGLIGAKNKIGNFIGVAPDCKLFICKLSENSVLADELTKRYAEAINWCAEQDDIQVISVSWGNRWGRYVAELQIAIDNAIAKKKIITCAIGNAPKLVSRSFKYPACLNNTISVGAIPSSIGRLYPFCNNYLTCATIGYNLGSYALKGHELEQKTGTSQANAIVAGIIALLLERLQPTNPHNDIKKILEDISIDQIFEGTENNVASTAIIPIIDCNLLIKQFIL
jgi:subtilisin family serine protease